MLSQYLLLVLPAMVFARINVEVSGKFEGEQPSLKVFYSGKHVDIISDREMITFGLTDNNIKNGVNAYFGKRPDDAYLRSPTPWGDLYQSYNWNQVARTLVPRHGRILKIASQPQIVMKQIFENNSTRPATFNVGISQSVENTVSSSWSKGGELTMSQEISYGFDIEVAELGGSTSLSYTSSWGTNTEKSQSVTLGSTSAMEVVLAPGQGVTAELQATRGMIQIEMEYEASLDGAVAVNYDDVHRGHHFWGLDVNAVMNHGNLKNKMMSKEVIEIGFYSNSRIIVRDMNLGTKLMDVAL